MASTDASVGLDRVTRAPMAISMRSVWSRLGFGSRTVVRPAAKIPPSNTADLICALATGVS